MSLLLEIKVFPASGRQKIILEADKSLKCFLKSPPERGKANAELTKLISKKLKIPQENIKIVSGATSRKKRIKIESNMAPEDALQKLLA